MAKSTTSEGMRQTGAQMVTTYGLLDKEATTLNVYVDSMHWIGTAGPIFKNAVADWNRNFFTIASHLDTMANFLSAGASDIDDAEYQNAATGDFNEAYGINGSNG